MVNALPLLFGLGAAALGVLVLLSGVGKLRSWNTLRSSAAGAVTGAGMAEVEGTAKPLRETLDPPRGDAESVVYEYEKEEYRPDTDNDGGSDWHTVDSDSGNVPFVVDSDGQAVVVDPADADHLLADSREKSGNGIRHTSSRLDVGESCYAAGTAVSAADSSVDTDGQQYVLERGDGALGGSLGAITGSPFVVSDSGEEAAESRLLKGGLVATVAGVLVTGLGSVFLLIGFGG